MIRASVCLIRDVGSNWDDSCVLTESTGVSGGESNVSALSPPGSPGVLDLPDSASVDSDEEDCVVDSGSAVVEDT